MLQNGTFLNDAEIIGDVSDDILNTKIRIAQGSKGNHPQGSWRSPEGTFGQFLSASTTHNEGEKDGTCFLQGAVHNGVRRSQAVTDIYLLGADIDTGFPVEEFIHEVKKLGKFCYIYSTHSNMKSHTDIQKSALIKWIKEERDPTIEDATAYLLGVKHYEPYILDGAILLPEVMSPKGPMIRVAHQPMPKYRAIFLLDKPFEPTKRNIDPQKGILEWKERYAGFCYALGVPFDRSCVDPARLFYLPRHVAGNDFFAVIIAGDKVNLEEVKRMTAADSAKEGSNVFIDEYNEKKQYKTTNLLKFLKKYGDRFLVEDLYEDAGQERRGSGSEGGSIYACPNEGQHTYTDKPSMGHWCKDGEDDEQFVAFCHHNTCVDLDRADFVDMLCQQMGILDAEKLIEKYVPRYDDDLPDMGWNTTPEQFQISLEAGGFPSKDAALAALSHIEKTDMSAISAWVRKVGASGLSSGDEASLQSKIFIEYKLPMQVIKAEMKAGAKDRKNVEIKNKELDPEDLSELEKFNQEFAVVNAGNSVRIMRNDNPTALPRTLMENEFHTLTANKIMYEDDGKGSLKKVPLSKKWLEWEKRRQYDGIVFEPSMSEDEAARRKLWNTWNGFPKRGVPGDWSLMHDHIKTTLCQNNNDYYVWLMTWIAQIFQYPGEKLGSAVAIKGKKGAGKSIVFGYIKDAIGPEYAIKTSHRSQITGNFNSHLGNKILMVCEEAFWAGDNSSGGVLKDLITSSAMMMEKKGMDIIEVSNYIRLVMISNENWIVPAGLDDERRFLVLECGDDKIGNIEFFAGVAKQMKEGGLEAMIYFFEHWVPEDHMIECYGKPQPMTWELLRTPPRTPWLAEQGVETLGADERFFLTCAMYGMIGIDDGEDTLPTPLLIGIRQKINLKNLAYHYDKAISKGYVGKHYSGNIGHMLKLCQKWLLSDWSIYHDSNGEQYILLGELENIRTALAARGVKMQDYKFVANIEDIYKEDNAKQTDVTTVSKSERRFG